ncbi:MAG: UDP-N-acetylmuramoyl-L-alanine--D-glutamate ligase [Gammaproteobacteria bacterium]
MNGLPQHNDDRKALHDVGLDPDLRYLVLGLGITGLSAVQYLARHGLQVAVADTREAPPGLEQLRESYPDVAVFTGPFSDDVAEHADCLVVSPGICVRETPVVRARDKGAEIIGDVELFARAVDKPVIGITGTNGKSTVTTLVGDMAAEAGYKVKVGGNLGAPALDLLAEPETELYVLELSSFQMETTDSLRPLVATVLNLSEDHMDRYDSFDDYVAAKSKLVRSAGKRLGNREDPLALALGADNTFGLDAPESPESWGLVSDERGETWLAKGNSLLLKASELRVPGRHNLSNALAAMALADMAGAGGIHIPVEAMIKVLRGFNGLHHRTEWVGEFNGVRWFNDSKGTNLGATIAAVQGMPGPLILVLGGDGKGADFQPLVDALGDSVKGVILFGRDGGLIGELIGDRIPTRRANSLESLVDTAKSWAMPGDSVLFSPACASFDMFPNYARRGDEFKRVVRERCS